MHVGIVVAVASTVAGGDASVGAAAVYGVGVAVVVDVGVQGRAVGCSWKCVPVVVSVVGTTGGDAGGCGVRIVRGYAWAAGGMSGGGGVGAVGVASMSGRRRRGYACVAATLTVWVGLLGSGVLGRHAGRGRVNCFAMVPRHVRGRRWCGCVWVAGACRGHVASWPSRRRLPSRACCELSLALCGGA